ncbi:GTP-binding protein [Methanoculleus sp. FWC-SCC1]|uniref:GTP-binding protein n=1 Tax=Methanoculleus frigidifontis TaxID=2584085 RepID=A0ABT8MAM5_9EURY|nr:GTP-binding protein [Methanoculleus sp. FWC-SCC1]MDN7024983.1 GTP-binding protein [Methanoculleus sp. FWC-SCC1]
MAADRLKIVVFGGFNAGKSTFVRALDAGARHIEAKTEGGTTTVAFDFGRFETNGRKVYVFGTPGQERFEFVREILARGMNGAIIVVDATVGCDATTMQTYAWLKEQRTPIAVMLNKCDLPGARPDAYADLLQADMTHRISAREKANVRPAMEAFVASLVESG